MKVKKVNKKSKVLKEPEFGCLTDIPSINISKGCIHRCVYCYARGFPETPEDHILLYQNIPDLLITELEKRRLKGEIPRWVTFSTASDPFQPGWAIQEITYKTTEILLKNKISVSFLTKGKIDEKFFPLFKEFSNQISITFGLISLNSKIHDIFEPKTASYLIRLRQIEKLKNIGIKIGIRIDPIIPYFTDSEKTVDSMFKRFKVLGIKEVSISYLILRPYVIDQMKKELPTKVFRRILLFYQGQPWMREISYALTKLCKPLYRKLKYKMFKEIGKVYGINIRICGCKNPDLPFEPCSSFRAKKRINEKRISLVGNL